MMYRTGLLAAVVCLALAGGAGCGDDDGGTNDNNNNATGPVCGDGNLDPGELCDDGEQNSDTTPDACRTDCRTAYCSDGVLDSGEQCDEGQANSDLLPGACRRDCLRAHCGDGVLDPGEACDDGNAADGDGCTEYCEVEDHFDCSGSPSVCTCEPFYSGAACDACVVYVDVDQTESAENGQSWATAFSRVQPGIDAAWEAGPGCEVWVAEGTYDIFEYTILNTVTLRDGVGVYGGFGGTETSRSQRDWANRPTLLEGDNHTDSPVYHVVSAVDTRDATLDGFTIQGGQCFGVDDIDSRGCGVNIKASIISIANCTIRDNVGVMGAGIASEGSRVAVRDTTIEGNNGQDLGAGVWAHSGALDFDNVTFRSNSINGEGGGVYLTFGWHTFTDCLFEDNRSGGQGGALAVLQGNITVTDTTFLNNRVWAPAYTEGYSSAGGAVHFDSTGYTTFERCSFEGNWAGHGGAMRIQNRATHLEITDSSFTQNLAYNPNYDVTSDIGEGGGAIYVDTDGLIVDGCLFEDNRALFGGALRVHDRNLTVRNSTFRSNDATEIDLGGGDYYGGLGGAVYSSAQWIHFESCLFEDNNADFRGGGMHYTWGPLDLVNSTFVGNHAGARGGGFDSVNAAISAVLRNNIFWGNTALVGQPQVNSFGGQPADVVTCLVEGGYASGTDITTANPLFVDAANGDYHLQSGSPAIDVGVATVAPSTDLEGNPRVDVGGVGTSVTDLGCYEFQP